LPISHTDARPDDIKLRDSASAILGHGNSATLRRIDGTCIPVVALFLASDYDACKSRLPEPGTGWYQIYPIRTSRLGNDNRDSPPREHQRLPNFNVSRREYERGEK